MIIYYHYANHVNTGTLTTSLHYEFVLVIYVTLLNKKRTYKTPFFIYILFYILTNKLNYSTVLSDC